jgi:hypothetical protein
MLKYKENFQYQQCKFKLKSGPWFTLQCFMNYCVYGLFQGTIPELAWNKWQYGIYLVTLFLEQVGLLFLSSLSSQSV